MSVSPKAGTFTAPCRQHGRERGRAEEREKGRAGAESEGETGEGERESVVIGRAGGER